MKHIHHLRASWLIAAVLVAVVIGEVTASYVSRMLDVRCPSVAVGAICVALVVGAVSVLYDGCE